MIKKKGNPNPSPATRFQPGNSLGGRPRMTKEQKALALSTRTQVKIVMTEYLTLTVQEINDLLDAAELPIIDMMILKALRNGYTSDQMVTTDWILDHVMGKQATKVEVKNTTGVDLSKLSTKEIENLKAIAEKAGSSDD